jgi:hypothetical protein
MAGTSFYRRGFTMIAEMIDVTGLPEQVVADIQKLVATLRKQLPAANQTAS